jgi:4-hydroxybenzoate polyprenyltransferase
MAIRPFLELVRFSHTVFALPFALLSALLAAHLTPTAIPLRYWVGIVLAMVTGRTVAMGFNRIVDRSMDGANPRTAMRHLAAGKMRLGSAVALTALSAAAFIGSTTLFLPCNRLPLLLSVPVLSFLCAYSYTKRFTVFAHFWLGAALMLAPISAWIAMRGLEVMNDPADLYPALILGCGVLFWVAGFDVIYACQDAAFDAGAGLFSIPGRFGVRRALQLARLMHLVAVFFFAALPLVYPQLGWIYLSGVGAIAVLLIYEHAIVRPDDLERVNIAFFRVNAAISIGLLVVTAIDLFLVAKGAGGG